MSFKKDGIKQDIAQMKKLGEKIASSPETARNFIMSLGMHNENGTLKEQFQLSDKDITLTPLDLIHSLGEFDYDPCGIPTHNTAKNIISLPKDGLSVDWIGRVWLKPPYSNPKPWIEKLIAHKNGIALVLNSTDTKWFQLALKNANGLFLLEGRPKFTRLDLSKVTIMRGVVLFAFGKENALILKNCNLKGYYIDLNYN